jgi:polyhydroxybutyrate depolymerase
LVVVLAVVATTSACTARERGAAAPTATTAAPPTAAPPTTAAGCTPGRTHAAGQTSETFAGGRTYVLYVPAGYTGDRPVPVVFEFHGHGSSAGAQVVYGDFRGLADRDGFVVVAPDGLVTAADPGRHFNLFEASATEADDVAFTVSLLDHLSSVLCVDRRRVYATGMSNGGAMSSALACRAADRFAAIGPVAVVLYLPQCSGAARPVPVAGFAGTADPVVPYDGGRVNCCNNPVLPSAPKSMADFAAHNGCTGSPVETRPSPSVLVRRWSAGCKDGAVVDFYTIEGGGHTWPGAAVKPPTLGVTTDEINATEVLWAFFRDHPMPA